MSGVSGYLKAGEKERSTDGSESVASAFTPAPAPVEETDWPEEALIGVCHKCRFRLRAAAVLAAVAMEWEEGVEATAEREAAVEVDAEAGVSGNGESDGVNGSMGECGWCCCGVVGSLPLLNP